MMQTSSPKRSVTACNEAGRKAVTVTSAFIPIEMSAALVPTTDAELVGLVPEAVLRAVPEDRWGELDLGPDRTVESRLA